MGKRKTIEDEIDSTCRSIAKRIATLSEMMNDGRITDALLDDFAANALSLPVVENKKHRPAKPVKDPHAPTRNLTSYIHYTNDNRKKIVQEHPGMGPRDVARALGEGWRGLSAKEKAKYDQLAKDDLQRYNDEMKVYKESNEAGSNNEHSDTDANSDSDDEEDELMSDPPPKFKQLAKKSTSLPKAKAKSTASNDNDSDPSSESDSDSDSSSSEESSSSSDSSDSDDN